MPASTSDVYRRSRDQGGVVTARQAAEPAKVPKTTEHVECERASGPTPSKSATRATLRRKKKSWRTRKWALKNARSPSEVRVEGADFGQSFRAMTRKFTREMWDDVKYVHGMAKLCALLFRL
eukprot:scaffold576_cov260-Pinguiococcus_pyrenoidosus.AAC.85